MKKQDLIDALEVVKPGLASKELIEQSTSFAFVDGRVVTYNDEISISHPVEGLDLTGAIQATELYAILKKLKQDEIEISVNENEIVLSAGKVKCGLLLQSEIKLPLTEIDEIQKWKTLPAGFIVAMQMAMMSCGTDNSKPILTCVHIHPEYIEGTNGFALYKSIMTTRFIKAPILIPATSASILSRFAPAKIAVTDGWVHFKSDNGAILSCRTFADKYPDTSKITKITGVLLTFPKTIMAILDRATVFGKHGAKVTDEDVDIIIDKKKIKISSKSESGWFEESANIDFEGERLSFKIMPSLLKGILASTTSCLYCGHALKFEGENWVFISMLIS